MNDLKREWYDIKTLLPCVISYCWKNQMCNTSALSSFLHPIRFLGITEIERLLCFLKNSLISIVTMLCFTVRECYRMNVSTAPNWNLIPNMMVSEDKAIGRWLGHDCEALIDGISALMEKTLESSFTPSAIWS